MFALEVFVRAATLLSGVWLVVAENALSFLFAVVPRFECRAGALRAFILWHLKVVCAQPMDRSSSSKEDPWAQYKFDLSREAKRRGLDASELLCCVFQFGIGEGILKCESTARHSSVAGNLAEEFKAQSGVVAHSSSWSPAAYGRGTLPGEDDGHEDFFQGGDEGGWLATPTPLL